MSLPRDTDNKLSVDIRKQMEQAVDEHYNRVSGDYLHQHTLMEELARAQRHHTRTIWPNIVDADGRKGMIAIRLHLKIGDEFPFRNFMSVLQGDRVYIWIVHPNGPVTLEDEAAMFPSDTLMSQLRLLL